MSDLNITSLHEPPDIGESWRIWIAENIMFGAPPLSLIPILIQKGIPPQIALSEVMTATHSPYIKGAIRLKNRIAKRDWLLNIPSQLNALHPVQIPRISQLSTQEFLEHYYSQNRPVIITNRLKENTAYQTWTLDHLIGRYADRIVEVQSGRNNDTDYEMNSVLHKEEMKFGDYLQKIKNSGPTNDYYMTANNDNKNRAALHDLWTDIPTLPDYLDGSSSGFLWIGPQGTKTPFHHDLTNNFMAQIMGRKCVRFIAPWDTPKLSNYKHCFTPLDGDQMQWRNDPDLATIQVTECILEAGEVLFLPVGWWHYVEALDISITIAFTNFKWNNDFYTRYPTDHNF